MRKTSFLTETFKKLHVSIQSTLKARYKLVHGPQEIVERTRHFLKWADFSPVALKKVVSAMENLEFLPAGNTLMIDEHNLPRPNCSVIAPGFNFTFSDPKLTTKLWENNIGIGMNLNNLHDPVAYLKEQSKINNDIAPEWNRPRRGNMGALSWDHPRAMEFALYKANHPDALSNFNLSLMFTREEFMIVEPTVFEVMRQCGDPGIVFVDNVPEIVNDPKLIYQMAPVPCGEQIMMPGETCNLGSINLNAPSFFDARTKTFKLDEFRETVKTSTTFLDFICDSTDLSDLPPVFDMMRTKYRRIGLGVMGFADLLEKMNLSYGSHASLNLIRDIGMVLKVESARTSQLLHIIRKTACPNIKVTCIAPTGGISLFTGNRGFGIEPFFSEASRIHWRDHLAVQNVWQQYIDGSVSKTINLPRFATALEIEECASIASVSLKSFTVYRDGSKNDQPKSLCEDCVVDDSTEKK